MIGGGLEGSGPSLPLCAASQHRFTAPTERTPSKGSASNGHPVGETTTSRTSTTTRTSTIAVNGERQTAKTEVRKQNAEPGDDNPKTEPKRDIKGEDRG